jgi:predicted oxidoreductase (fatty acid repression mutant protein)
MQRIIFVIMTSLLLVLIGCSKKLDDHQAEAVAPIVKPVAILDNWQYSSSKDEMTGTVINFANNESINTVNFQFPYGGEQHGTIQIWDNNIIFNIQKGQLVCNDSCLVLVKFDDGTAINYIAKKIGDDSTQLSFLDSEFLEKMKKSKQLKIQVHAYQNEFPIFIFDVSGFKTPAPTQYNEQKDASVGTGGAVPNSFAVQIGAYANAVTANQELKKLKKWGFKAYEEKIGDNMRLRLGPYSERSQAEKVGKQLEKRGLYPVIVSSK